MVLRLAICLAGATSVSAGDAAAVFIATGVSAAGPTSSSALGDAAAAGCHVSFTMCASNNVQNRTDFDNFPFKSKYPGYCGHRRFDESWSKSELSLDRR